MITNAHKQAVIKRLAEQRPLFAGSDAAFARSLGINSAQYSRVKNGETDGVLAEKVWLTLSRKFNVQLNGSEEWKTASTDVFEFITGQLEACQSQSIAGLLCDIAGIGKTYAAKIYASTHKNAVYVDCSQTKSRQLLIKHIAAQFGVNVTGSYYDTYEDLAYYLRTLESPIIILDEVGDLRYDAFLEIKALWNATEHCCGWYMMGADGLKRKIERAVENSKVGFAEIFDRYGKKYQRVSPKTGEDLKLFIRRQAALIIKVNAPQGVNMQTLLTSTEDSLRRVYTEVQKLRYLSNESTAG